MNSKKWYTTALISLIVIVLEIVSVFVFILPSVRMDGVFKALLKGDDDKAQECLDKLSDKKQDKVEELMEDFATYEYNQYAAGTITYGELDDIYEAIEELDGYSGFAEKYYVQANYKELIAIYEKGLDEYKTNGDSAAYKDMEDEFYDVYDTSYGNQELDNALIAYIDEKYNLYKNGSVTYEVMQQYIDVAADYFIGNPCYHVWDIEDELYYISVYQKDFEEAQGYYDAEEYFETIEYCDNELDYIDEDDTTGYREKFQQLRDDAYEKGKTFYIEKAKNLISGNDMAGARELVSRIKEVYGSEVDLSAVEELMKDPWMDVYAAYMANWEENLKNDIASGVKIGELDDSSLIDIHSNMPDSLYLYDFDGNGTPELTLVNSRYAYIYGFDGSKIVFTGCIQIATFCKAPYLIAIPTVMKEGYTGYELLKFENNTWSIVDYYMAAEDGSECIVNGNSVSYEECEAMHNSIAGYEDTAAAEATDGVSIANYEAFIYSYGQE